MLRYFEAQQWVTKEEMTVGIDTVLDSYDHGKTCCGKTAAASSTAEMADAKRSRGYVKEEINLNKDLLADNQGAMNKITAPSVTSLLHHHCCLP